MAVQVEAALQAIEHGDSPRHRGSLMQLWLQKVDSLRWLMAERQRLNALGLSAGTHSETSFGPMLAFLHSQQVMLSGDCMCRYEGHSRPGIGRLGRVLPRCGLLCRVP